MSLVCKQCATAANSVWQRTNPKNRMVTSAKQRAKAKGLPFSITIANIEIPELCPVLGIPLAVGVNGKYEPGSPSLDRIIPHLGYIPGNVAVISDRANRLKKDASPDEIKRLHEWMQQQ